MKNKIFTLSIIFFLVTSSLFSQNSIININNNELTPSAITVPYYESFYNTSIPALWTTSQSSLFSFVNDGNQPYYVVALNQGSMVQFAGYSSSSGTVGYLRSPEFSNLITGMEVNFWFYRQNGSNGHPGSLSVYANSTTEITNAVLLTTIPRVYTKVPSEVSPGWYRYTAVLPADTFKYIIFKFYSDHTANMYLDEISFTDPVGCTNPPVNSVNIQSFNSNSVSFNWQKGSSETMWEVAYKKSSEINWTTTTSTDTFCTINGLIPSNLYQVKVRATCAQGGTSLWTFQKSFFTVCDPIQTIPYLMTFDSVPLNSLPTCYQTILDPNASIQTVTLSGTNQGLDFFSYNSDNNCILILPPFQDSINSLRVKFKVVAGSQSYTAYIIGYLTDYNDPYSFEYLAGGNPLSNNWYFCDFNTLTSLTGNERFAIEMRGILGYHVRIDSLMVCNPDPCLPPLRLNSDHVQSNQATLHWTPSPYGTPTNYDLQYREIDSSNWILIPNVNPPYILSGLSAQTTYYYKVKSNCFPNITQYSQIDSFTTQCNSTYYDQFSETFEFMLPNNCWEMKSGYLLDTGNASLQTSSGGWALSNGFETSAALANLSLYYHYWLITPPIDIGDGSTLKQLEFDMAVTEESSTGQGNIGLSPNARFVVLISTDYGETWNTDGILRDWNNNNGTHFNTVNNTLQTKAIPLFDSLTMSNYSGIVKFAFYAYISDPEYGYDNNIHIDNIKINPYSSCLKPRILSGTNITTSSIQLNWTQTGTASSWIVEYGPEGFVLGSGISQASTQTSCVINALQPATRYDFYVKSVCGLGDTSVFSFKKTICTACYNEQLPYYESFNLNMIPNCWKQQNSSSLNERWSLSQTNFAGGNSNELKCSKKNADGTSRIISPAIDFTGINEAILFFKYFLDAYGEGILLKVQTSADMNIWTDQPFSISTGQNNLGPTTCMVNLHSLNGVRYIAWVVDGYFYQIDAWYIDDVCITTNSLYCPPPSNLVMGNQTLNSVQVLWTPAGSESQWEIFYKPTTSSTWSSAIVNGSPNYTLTSLTPLTSYHVKVKAICDQVQSSFSNTLIFTVANQYTILASHDENSTITPSGNLYVNQGDNLSFTFSALQGYNIESLLVDGVNQNPIPTSYTFTNVQANHSISVLSISNEINTHENSNEIELFPNPANNYFDLKVNPNILQTRFCRVINVFGQVVKAFNIENEVTRVNIEELPKGMYLIIIDAKHDLVSKKLIKN